jgi:hypothetical protein
MRNPLQRLLTLAAGSRPAGNEAVPTGLSGGLLPQQKMNAFTVALDGAQYIFIGWCISDKWSVNVH